MNDQTAIQKSNGNTGMTRVKNYLLSEEVVDRFKQMMGANAPYYLNQVLIVVANNAELQKCSPPSILISAMRAASLRLSVDPVQGHAWIIPYSGQATFQIGYRGVYELAMRTGLYRFINVIDIFEGEELIENRMTGMHTIGGQRTGNRVIARMLYFQLTNGFEKTYPMTVEEIEAHAQKYSKSYSGRRSPWNDPDERPKMERKTVLMNGLRKWGRFVSEDMEIINQIEDGETWPNRVGIPEEGEVTPPPVEPKRTQAQNLNDLGFETPEEPPFDGEFSDAPVEEPQEEPVNKFADLDFSAQADPVNAFWQLVSRVGMPKDEAQAVVKENRKDFVAAYKALRGSSWCK